MIGATGINREAAAAGSLGSAADLARSTPDPTPSVKSDATEVDALAALVAERRAEFGIREKPAQDIADTIRQRFGNIAAKCSSEDEAREKAEYEARRKAAWEREQRYREEATASMVARCQAVLNARSGPQTLASFVVASNNATTRTAQENVLRGLREYAKDAAGASPLRNAIFYGPCGSGKDHLAMGLLREVAKVRQVSSAAVLGQDLFAEIRKKLGDDKDESEVIREFAGPDVLIVSDPLPPSGALTEWQAACLFRLVNTRYTGGKATWVTINVADGGEAVRRMGAATWDRIRHEAWVFRCGWETHRKPHKVWGGE